MPQNIIADALYLCGVRESAITLVFFITTSLFKNTQSFCLREKRQKVTDKNQEYNFYLLLFVNRFSVRAPPGVIY
jgi:hypothetical protein